MLKCIVCVLVLFISLPVLAEVKEVELTNSQVLSTAHNMINTGDLDNATSLLNNLLQTNDKNARTAALFELGRVAIAHGDFSTAERYFLAILKYNPDATFVRIELAKAYLLDGKYNSADFNLRLALADKTLPAIP